MESLGTVFFLYGSPAYRLLRTPEYEQWVYPLKTPRARAILSNDLRAGWWDLAWKRTAFQLPPLRTGTHATLKYDW